MALPHRARRQVPEGRPSVFGTSTARQDLRSATRQELMARACPRQAAEENRKMNPQLVSGRELVGLVYSTKNRSRLGKRSWFPRPPLRHQTERKTDCARPRSDHRHLDRRRYYQKGCGVLRLADRLTSIQALSIHSGPLDHRADAGQESVGKFLTPTVVPVPRRRMLRRHQLACWLRLPPAHLEEVK